MNKTEIGSQGRATYVVRSTELFCDASYSQPSVAAELYVLIKQVYLTVAVGYCFMYFYLLFEAKLAAGMLS